VFAGSVRQATLCHTMTVDPAAVIAASAAAFVVGLGKGGLALMGMLGVPLMSFAMSPIRAAAILLPVYVFSDIAAVWMYRRHFSGRNLPGHGFLFETISVADISIASFFRNAHFAGFAIDTTRWPKTASFVSHVLNQGSFAALRPFEVLCLRTRISNQREALREAGAPISADTLGIEAPRRGIMAT